MMNLTDLPVDCLSNIMSLTTPRDVLRSSAVSKQFLYASESDTAWDTFVPSHCDNIISLIPRDHADSKKKLFCYLSHSPILLENSTESFALDKWSGKICYMLGARALSIVWGTSPEYWSWESVPESRFPECAVLNNVCWLDIKGKIHTTLLSPSATYGAYFVYKIKPDSSDYGSGNQGLGIPMKVSVTETDEDGLPKDNNHVTLIKRVYLKVPRSPAATVELPVVRDDGWMEIEMGRYRVGADCAVERAVLEMALKEVEILNWKYGLIVLGIELRPLS